MTAFRPDDHPAQPDFPNAVCRGCGWLRDVIWARPGGCQNCGDDRVDRLEGRTLFVCSCGWLRLEPFDRCRCGAVILPDPEPGMVQVHGPDPAGRSERKVKNFLRVTLAACIKD